MAKNVCCFIIVLVITAILGILFIESGIQYSKTDNVLETTCNIFSVHYTKNITDTKNMVTCDCGRNCKNPEGMCVKIYASANFESNKYSKIAMIGTNLQREIEQCTFQEKKCKEVPRSHALSEYYNMAKPFIEKKNNNETFECLYHNGNIYLDNSFDIDTFIGITVSFGIFVICSIVSCIIYIKEDCCEKKQQSDNYSV